jgi:uncharacterized protein YndB with AHSA1/START domain
MKIWIVSYADALFLASQGRLVESARRYRINEIRSWNRDSLERTSFYSLHKAILDLKRGAGYWLWKPFIIEETLKEMEDGDVVIYSDAGIEIVGELSPLIDLCLQKSGILLFAGHYDDLGAPGPNLCYKWTKRDCFVLMGCDEPHYHQGQLLDASFMVLAKTERSIAFIREWLFYCAQSQILTDDPNRCGGIYCNSPYKTLLSHHRGIIGQKDLILRLSRRIPAPQQQVFEVWASAKNMKKWLVPPGYAALAAEVDFCVGGKYRLTVRELSNEVQIDLEGKYIEICPPERLVYTWPWDTRVTVEFQNDGDSTVVVLLHESFPSEKIRELHATEWNLCLDRLANDFPASIP